LFAGPARAAAATGAVVFTTGEMGFYIADHERAMWMERFGTVAKETGMWLVVGYWNISADENRLFFMSPDGAIVHEYTKTYLTPYEPGKKGTGDLRTVEVAGVTVGGMICQDDNFMRLTRHYGNLKADVVLCPTADWWTIRTAHLQAVRARAIEGRYGIARGAANGISAIIGPRGEILAQQDHFRDGPGWVAADVPVIAGVTGFSRWGLWPGAAISVLVLAVTLWRKESFREADESI
jgi:apolipoprotein N-acyltransferase